MSNVGIFVAGTLVTLIVAAALFLVIWGALMDGKQSQPTAVTEKAGGEDRPSTASHLQDDAPVFSAPLGRRRIGVLGPDIEGES